MGGQNQMKVIQQNQQMGGMKQMGRIQQQGGMQQIYPQMNQMGGMPYSPNPMMNYPMSGVQMVYPYGQVYVGNPTNNTPGYNNNNRNNNRPFSPIDDDERIDLCSIQ